MSDERDDRLRGLMMAAMDGEIDDFINAFLKWSMTGETLGDTEDVEAG